MNNKIIKSIYSCLACVLFCMPTYAQVKQPDGTKATFINTLGDGNGATVEGYLGGTIVFTGEDSKNTDYTSINSAYVGASTTDDLRYSVWVEDGLVADDIILSSTDTWADFVFNEGYKLKALREVEAYIHQHKHLPDVPSAKDVSTGYRLHAVNTVFLQKIEELTLYAIGQDKKIEMLQKELIEMGKLKAEMELLKQAVNTMKK